ncbi:MAG: hypothetical protein E4H03_09890 [Myxococcales bacterium]|nr:MAG: hypothetical protein E4H03_09890 [Myxococcales bacterium]
MANDRSDPWPTLTIVGSLCGLALGAVVVMLLRRRDGGGGGRLLLPESSSPPDFDLSSFLSSPPLSPKYDKVIAVPSRPVARTVTISERDPTLILKAVGKRDWTIWVRVVGPPGAFARFMISNNSGDAIDVPAGGHHQMRLPAGEFLYAQGDMPCVTVSASGGEG